MQLRAKALATSLMVAVTANLASAQTSTISVSYVPQANSVLTPVENGGTLLFSPTLTETATTATVILLNKAINPAPISSILVTGDSFQAAGLPILPFSLPGGATLTFSIRFAPSQVGVRTGELKMDLAGTAFSANLNGSGSGASFTYEVIDSTGTRVILPNQDIVFPDTVLSQVSNLRVQVRNTGNVDGSISTLTATGAGFFLSDPPLIPASLAPGESTSISVAFAPLDPGISTGRLRIGTSVFNLSGSAIGSKLTYSYLIGSAVTPIKPGEAILFSPAAIGNTTTLPVSIKNEGTSAAAIAAIGLGDARNVYRLADLPAFPFSLAAGATVTFRVTFSPNAAGPFSSSLVVNSSTFPISGFGNPPGALPSYRYTDTSSTAQPLQQPTLGITLNEPYPLALQGVLTMAVGSDSFPTDPAVQFLTGGRQVPFAIPANSLRAVFSNGADTIRYQTGTVAETISFAATFATTAGFDLTPDAGQSLKILIPRLSPTLLTFKVANQTTNGLVLEVTGLATTRSLGKLDFTFASTDDVRLSGTQVGVSVETETSAWFRTASSQSFGGQFTIAVPFTIGGQLSDGATLLSKIKSISVNSTNEIGVSNSVTTILH